jgi:DNA-binding GntR family transcriptional regulator
MLRSQAYELFKERLFAGDLKPGQFLSQRELSELVGIGAGPMREALKRLEAESLVNLIPQRGIQITNVDAKLIREAFELRVILESVAARRFAANGPPDVAAQLEERTRAMIDLATTSQDPALLDEAMRVDWALHDALVDSLGNAIISEIHRINADKIRLIRLNQYYTFERVHPAMEEHLAIIVALRAGDAEGAVAALERHLDISRRRALGL